MAKGRKKRQPTPARFGAPDWRIGAAYRFSKIFGVHVTPDKVECPVLLFVTVGIITEDQEKAANSWQALYAYRNPGIRQPTGDGKSTFFDADDPDERDQALNDAWHRASRVMPRQVRDALDNVVVYHRWPKWFQARCGYTRDSSRDMKRRQELMEALDCLVRLWKGPELVRVAA